MKRVLIAFIIAGACAGAFATQASAHHSFAATYLEDKAITIEGELVQVLFRNPHSFVQMTVKERNGSQVRYSIEWGGAAQLGGQGVTRETLKPGDRLVISGNPGRVPSDHRVRMISLRRPSDGFGWGTRPGEVVD
ncbi:MAG: hypothetical protein HOP16_21620 [Acidobacteria bacterium]|nr:hypothetical protein [Acidobacteriota bacterium]